MNDYQEYRSYGSYLSRVFAIIIAFLLLIFAIWAVVRVASDDDEGTLGDTAPSFANNEDGEDESDLFVTTDDDSDQPVTVGLDDNGGGQTLATNTDAEGVDNPNANVAGATTSEAGTAGASSDDDLPSTGAELNIVLALGVASFIGAKLVFRTQD